MTISLDTAKHASFRDTIRGGVLCCIRSYMSQKRSRMIKGRKVRKQITQRKKGTQQKRGANFKSLNKRTRGTRVEVIRR